jgi:hypothetical protein
MCDFTALVQKLWNYCSILPPSLRCGATARQCGDYAEQLIPPVPGLFLKMADEALARGHQSPPFNPPSPGSGGTGKPSAVPQAFAEPGGARRPWVGHGRSFHVGWTAYVQRGYYDVGRLRSNYE